MGSPRFAASGASEKRWGEVSPRSHLDRRLLRELAEWSTGGYPVTSVYVDVDGRRYPRRADYLVRLEDLLKGVRVDEGLDKDRRRSVEDDLERIRGYVQDRFERGDTRGLAVFASSGARLWREVLVPRPVRDRLVVGTRPHLIPLEALVESNETFCTAVVDRERARILVSALGVVEEVDRFQDDVPGRHDQGGWAQARFQRHTRDHIHRHLKRVAETLLRLKERRPFDHLVLAGSEDLLAELERELHPYLIERLVDRTNLPITVPADEVLSHALAVEERLEAGREVAAVTRLASEAESATGRVVAGIEETLAALEAGRVDTLVVQFDLEASGVRCLSCGHLDVGGRRRCAVCGSAVERTSDLV